MREAFRNSLGRPDLCAGDIDAQGREFIHEGVNTMFKNKRIVAMVLCALMLFVPVAAMAMVAPSAPVEQKKDYLYAFWNASEVDGSDLVAAVEGYANKLKASPWESVDDAESAKEARKEIADKVEAYEKALKEFKKDLAEAEVAMNNAKRFDYKKMYDADGKVYGSKTKEEAQNNFDEAVKRLEASKKALNESVKNYEGLADFYNFVQKAITINEKAGIAATDFEAAKEAFDAAADFYEGLDENEELQALAAPMVLKQWNRLAALATDYQKASILDAQVDSVKELINKGNTKYEVMSTGEKGWILSDEAKNGCLKDVAEFKVEKKDGKFVGKVYGADGKEMKIGQQLTVYRPIGKDVKVLKAKVDGKEVTFAISTRGEQKYVSVSAVY